MYMLCCWSRTAQPGEGASGEEQNQQSLFARSTSPGLSARARASKNGKVAVQSHEGTKGTDAEKFDVAVEKKDVVALVHLLDSKQTINCSEQMHTWAENPRTVGALAGTRLAMLAQTTNKASIREAGAIPKIVEFLKSDEMDRVQTAIVALSFLTAECPENADAAYEAGAIPLLLKCSSASVACMRAATLTTLRNICMENDDYRTKFVELGGLMGLVNQIGCSARDLPNLADVQLEAVLNLQDMLEADDGSLVTEYAMIVIDADVEQRLESLLPTEDEELRGCVKEVLAALATVPRDEKVSGGSVNKTADDIYDANKASAGGVGFAVR
eukprot:TRINITY_DN63838_c0_g1_i1.p1 TRINITY_DN63838_c0_g1~~TRINITY_DN63838_c0_g1_i1.p1  ORF type:complete len:328 (-),score=67.25 TRINITY_DN63838_c0_g1_i1:123-1106(-)